MVILRVAVIGLGLAMLSLALPGDTFAADPPDKDSSAAEPLDATPEQVREWVRQLDADEFAVREEASARLMLCGGVAVEELARLNLPAQNLEVLSRGMNVLQELALASDVAVEEAARELLEELSKSDRQAAAARAAETLGTLNEVREARAIQQLQKLGAIVTTHTTDIGLVLVQQVPTVEINEDFTGAPADLKRLKYLHNVRMVQLAGDHITDDVLRYLADMPSIEFVKIKWAKISSKGVAQIAKLPNLQQLSILYSPVDNDAVEILKGVKSLANVRLYGTNISPAAAQQLNVALGGDDMIKKVDHRHGAFLGIGGDRDTQGCQVTMVQANTVAQKAGIQAGDVVVRFAGEPIEDFETLMRTISKYKARDTVKLELLQNGAPKTLEVTLGEWEW